MLWKFLDCVPRVSVCAHYVCVCRRSCLVVCAPVCVQCVSTHGVCVCVFSVCVSVSVSHGELNIALYYSLSLALTSAHLSHDCST